MTMPARARRAAAPQYRRILLIRTDRVGDLILSTPAIASFRRSFPNAHITALITKYTEPVLRLSNDIDEVAVLPDGGNSAGAKALVRALGADADLAVALAPITTDLRLAGWSGARRRIGYVYRRRWLSRLLASVVLTDFCISTADPGLADRYPDEPVMHEVHQVLALVKLAGGDRLSDELVLNVGEDDRAYARSIVSAGAVVVPLAPRWIAPNFGMAALQSLLSRLAADQRDVLVTYGSETKDAALALRAALPAKNVSWLGELPLLRWAAVLGQASAVISVDTGATHVAAALKVPVVAIFEREYYRLCSQEWSPWHVPSVLLCKPPRGADPTKLIEDVLAATRALQGGQAAAASS